MKITVIGTGYVGLVTGTCLAEVGNDVTCIDIDADKIQRLGRGEIPFFEPGLSELVNKNVEANKLNFEASIPKDTNMDLYFVCVGTPSREDGSSNMDYVYACVDQIVDVNPSATIVIKSTVPIGTNRALRAYLDSRGHQKIELVSNPEFLREGNAVSDSLQPDRIVVGVRSDQVGAKLVELYKPFFKGEPAILVFTPESSEMVKYAANCYLAMRISFVNEVSQLCEVAGANITQVTQGMGTDKRIGGHYLNPSVGFGGSCFPKDLRSMKASYDEVGLRPEILSAVIQTNKNQKNRFFQKITQHFSSQNGLMGKVVGVWGGAFKANTDDIRESASLDIIQKLLDAKATVHVYDPEASLNIKRYFGDKVSMFDDMYDAVQHSDALCIMTEWDQFRDPDLDKLKGVMKNPTIFDGRNLMDPQLMAQAGYKYHSIGR